MSLPNGHRILNSKERKKLLHTIHEQFGIEQLPEGAYIQNSKDKIFLINKDIDNINIDEIYIDAIGLYIGVWHIDGFRLSIEGAQLLAPQCTKNVVTLTTEERTKWLQGYDLPYENATQAFVIVTDGDNVLGCGKMRVRNEKGELLNYTSKARRLIVVNE